MGDENDVLRELGREMRGRKREREREGKRIKRKRRG